MGQWCEVGRLYNRGLRDREGVVGQKLGGSTVSVVGTVACRAGIWVGVYVCDAM